MINSKNLPETVRRGTLRRDTEWLQQGLAFIPTYVANGSGGWWTNSACTAAEKGVD